MAFWLKGGLMACGLLLGILLVLLILGIIFTNYDFLRIFLSSLFSTYLSIFSVFIYGAVIGALWGWIKKNKGITLFNSKAILVWAGKILFVLVLSLVFMFILAIPEWFFPYAPIIRDFIGIGGSPFAPVIDIVSICMIFILRKKYLSLSDSLKKKKILFLILVFISLLATFGAKIYGVGFHIRYENYGFNYELGGYYPRKMVFFGIYRPAQSSLFVALGSSPEVMYEWLVFYDKNEFTSSSCYIAWKEPDPHSGRSEFQKSLQKYSIVCQMKNGRKEYLDYITEKDLIEHNYPLPTEGNPRIKINSSESGARW